MQNPPPISSPDGQPFIPPPSQPGGGIDFTALISSQKMVLWAILASIIAVVLALALRNIPAVVTLINILRLGIAGFTGYAVFRLARALQLSWAWLAAVLAFVPCVGLIVLLVLSGQATEKLRAAGYQVGLMGAKNKIA